MTFISVPVLVAFIKLGLGGARGGGGWVYNYYYISLPNISELKQKVLVFAKEEKACELSMMNLKDAHSLDTVPGSDRYTNIWEADNRELIEAPRPARDSHGSKATQTMGTIQAGIPWRVRGASVQHER